MGESERLVAGSCPAAIFRSALALVLIFQRSIPILSRHGTRRTWCRSQGLDAPWVRLHSTRDPWYHLG